MVYCRASPRVLVLVVWQWCCEEYGSAAVPSSDQRVADELHKAASAAHTNMLLLTVLLSGAGMEVIKQLHSLNGDQRRPLRRG